MPVKKTPAKSIAGKGVVVVKPQAKRIASSVTELRRKPVAVVVPPAEEPKKEKPKAVRYLIEFNDGTVREARDRHAEVLVEYMAECESICTTQGMVYYTGPEMHKYSAAEWAKKQSEGK